MAHWGKGWRVDVYNTGRLPDFLGVKWALGGQVGTPGNHQTHLLLTLGNGLSQEPKRSLCDPPPLLAPHGAPWSFRTWGRGTRAPRCPSPASLHGRKLPWSIPAWWTSGLYCHWNSVGSAGPFCSRKLQLWTHICLPGTLTGPRSFSRATHKRLQQNHPVKTGRPLAFPGAPPAASPSGGSVGLAELSVSSLMLQLDATSCL